MPKPRKALVSLDATPYYHVVSRCVRRAFLCGDDIASSKSYEHRRDWIESRILSFSKVFAIDICAYAVMSNHYHLVLRLDQEQAAQWDSREVIERWHHLYAGHPFTHAWLAGKPLSSGERMLVEDLVATWRERLTSLSWFMRCLNEPIAREANREDGCTGRFWEGRFKSQALLDEKALLACMAYVELNPVRAKMAETPEESDFTSIQTRIRAALNATEEGSQQPTTLLPFVGYPREPMPKGLPYRLRDYLELVDWTGRALRDDKRGAIAQSTPPILERLKIDPQYWLVVANEFEGRFNGLVGAAQRLKQAAAQLGYQRTPNLSACRQLLG